jgi:RES domain
MHIDAGLLASQTKQYALKNYLRVFPSIYVTTPLGAGPGYSRFGGKAGNFSVLYAASNLATAISETVIRDRFEGVADRRLFIEEFQDWVVVQLRTILPLQVVDLRKGGCLKLGISTEIAGAKGFEEAQQFAQFLHDNSKFDGILYSSRLTGRNCVAIFNRAVLSRLSDLRTVPLVRVTNLRTALTSLNVQLIR